MQELKELQKHLKGEQAVVGMVLGNKEEVGTGWVDVFLCKLSEIKEKCVDCAKFTSFYNTINELHEFRVIHV